MEEAYLEKKKITYERTYVEISLDAVVENVRSMTKNIAEGTGIIGVIKTDGYGHGAIPIAGELETMENIYGFAVATAEEAHILRKAGITKPLLILGYTFPYSYPMLAEEEICPAVFREDSLQPLAEAAGRLGKTLKVHIKVDTGMGRIGIAPDESGIAFIRRLLEYKELKIEGIFTHFARADETDKTAALGQYTLFCDFVNRVEKELGIEIPVKHCANSAGIMELPETCMDVMRAGIILYGLYPSCEIDKKGMSLYPALSWYSHIVYIKTLHKGQSVSYGGTFTAKEDMRVATVPVGYGDGYPRGLSGKGYVLVHGRKAPILGRICMDQFMVNVSHIPEAAEGDMVTLLGTDGDLCISAEELGTLSGRFNYELVCDIGKRVPRVYVKKGKVVAVKDYNEDYK